MKTEISRRLSLTDQLERCLKAQPGIWLSMSELAAVGGLGGWRTRLSDLRLKRKMCIEWNKKNGAASRHRYLPYPPLGRSAESTTGYLPLFEREIRAHR